MAEYIESVVTQTSKLDWAFPFQRTGSFPIDRSSLFSSYADAVKYAAGNDENGNASDERLLGGTSYVGQPISVYDAEKKAVTLYIINPDRTLKEVGSAPVGDNTTIEIKDGNIALKGFADAGEGAQLRKKSDGSLEWFIPSTDTVDGLQNAVGGLRSDVDSLQDEMEAVPGQITKAITDLKLGETYEALGAAEDVKEEIEGIIGEVAEGKTVVKMIEDAQTAATYDDTAIAGRVKAIEDDYLKAADKKELGDKLNTLIGNDTGLSAREIAVDELAKKLIPADAAEALNSLEEIAAWIQDHPGSASAMNEAIQKNTHDISANKQSIEANDEDILALQGDVEDINNLIGALPEGTNAANVIDYIGKQIEGLSIEDYAKQADLNGLTGRVETAEQKLAGIENGAEANKVQTVDTTEFTLNGRHLTIGKIGQDKITGLEAALNDKVQKVEGSRLLTEDEAEKLEKLVLGEDGSVEVSGSIAAGNVDGLAEWITARADTLKGLSENNLTKALLDKLNAIEAGAQVNAIDFVSEEFAISPENKTLSVFKIDRGKISGLSEALDKLVEKVDGKGLSTNDLTDELLSKINESQANVIEEIQVNGVKISPVNKAIDIKANHVVKGSTEVTVAEDGTLGIGAVNLNKLVQSEGDWLVLNGGGASM